jgi:hypothetical protein
MKIKLYTLSHDVNILKEIDYNGGQFTAEEHAYAVKKEYGETTYETKEQLIRDYLFKDSNKLECLSFLIDHINGSGYKNILSLGAGPCVLEYLLEMSLPEKSQLIAADFDEFIVEKAKKFFPQLIVEKFDFQKDDFKSFRTKLDISFDLVIFFGSAYIMDDQEFIKLFGDLKKNGVKQIIDFHAGYMNIKSQIMHGPLNFLRTNPTIRKWFRTTPLANDGYRGKFHGYGRNRSAIKKLYKKSGLSVKLETCIGGYKYVSILE